MKRSLILTVTLICVLSPLAFAHADLIPECSVYGSIVSVNNGQSTTIPVRACGLCDFWHLANNVVNFLLFTVSIPLLTIVMLYGGTMMVISGGNPGNISKGKTAMTNAIVGLLIAFCAWAVVNTFVHTLANGELAGAWSKIPECVSPLIPPPTELPSIGAGDDAQTTTSYWTVQVCPSITCTAEFYDQFHVSDQGKYDSKTACEAVGNTIGGTQPANWRCAERVTTTPNNTSTNPSDYYHDAEARSALANIAEVKTNACSLNTTLDPATVCAMPFGSRSRPSASGGCTSLELIPKSTVPKLVALKAKIPSSLSFYISGGTEYGHITHGPCNPIVDIVPGSPGNKALTQGNLQILRDAARTVGGILPNTRCEASGGSNIEDCDPTKGADHVHVKFAQ